jgi:hypothetical protein
MKTQELLFSFMRSRSWKGPWGRYLGIESGEEICGKPE